MKFLTASVNTLFLVVHCVYLVVDVLDEPVAGFHNLLDDVAVARFLLSLNVELSACPLKRDGRVNLALHFTLLNFNLLLQIVKQSDGLVLIASHDVEPVLLPVILTVFHELVLLFVVHFAQQKLCLVFLLDDLFFELFIKVLQLILNFGEIV